MSEDSPAGRRRFLDLLLGIGRRRFSFLYPVLKVILPPKVAEAMEESVVAARVGELTPNSGKIFMFGRRLGNLMDTPSRELRAFDAICTHLQCMVQYRPDFAHIWCACHNGHFDLFGKNISGPRRDRFPVSMWRFEVNHIVVSRDRA